MLKQFFEASYDYSKRGLYVEQVTIQNLAYTKSLDAGGSLSCSYATAIEILIFRWCKLGRNCAYLSGTSHRRKPPVEGFAEAACLKG